MVLGERMSMNASLVPAGTRVADIGCDHGKLSVYLVEKGTATEVVASDVAEGPLGRAQETVREAGLTDKIHIRLGYGAETIGMDADGRPEVDTAVMAGIGGMLALDIVKRSIDIFRKLDCFIIQAQSNLDAMRRQMYEMGFVITDEKMAREDGKYYTAIRYEADRSYAGADDAGTDEDVGYKIGAANMTRVSYKYAADDGSIITGRDLDKADLIYGPVLTRTLPPVFTEYLKQEERIHTGILKSLTGTGNEERVNEIKERIGIIAGLLDGQETR